MSGALELGIIIPAFNERDNVRPLLAALASALHGIEYEVIYVDDDSPDGTSGLVRQIARTSPRVRVLQRVGRRGLSSACLEGMLATAAPYIAVMDGDMQHDERILPEMLFRLKKDQLDLVVATRNAGHGSMGEFSAKRVQMSNLGRSVSQLVTHADLSDPMSGYFLLDRRFLEEVVHSASGLGFKILVDLVSSSPRKVRFAEVPYTFRSRLHGDSKLDLVVLVEYFHLILDKTIGHIVPPRFVTFSLVGLAGLLMFLGLQFVLLNDFHLDFILTQALTAFFAMTANFFLNNTFTYRDRRLKGKKLVTGLLAFYVACMIGGFLNLRIASWARAAGLAWNTAGAAGLIIGAVWNYGVTSMITWRTGRRRTVRAAAAA
ncbi:MAG TPA: glycosyltransferase family 2 protein [Bryobacteraceae bacterium]|nr:glycosyltransferase family 2 protein [Bryobacteraceae bacterium]